MKKILFVIFGISALSFSSPYAEEFRDWKDLEKVSQHVNEAIHEMERVREANHYDLNGHGKNAEKLLREADNELHYAIESAKSAK